MATTMLVQGDSGKGSKTSTRKTDDTAARAAVLGFVRTPFHVRCNVVKVWRPLPTDIWVALSKPGDETRSRRVERRSLAGVAAMATLLMVGFSGIGLRTTAGGASLCFPLLGKSTPVPESDPPGPGWYYVSGQSLSPAFWVVGPTLLGWAFVRLIWIPAVAAGKPTRAATLTFARHLGAVYLYVYVMVVGGAAMMLPLILWAPKGTEAFRWYFWCFLFGESFFVPAAMWLRLAIHDASEQVFGRHRFTVLALYLTLFVVVPIIGMVQAGWPTSFRGGGHDDVHRNAPMGRIIQPPPSEKVGHPCRRLPAAAAP